MAEEPKKKPNLLLRLLAFLVTLALMLGAVALVVYRDELNFDALKRYFTYRSLEKSDTGQTDSFPYDSGGRGGYTDLGGDLLVWSGTGARIYSPGGVEFLSEPLLLNQPVANAGGGAAVVYDAGGYTLRVYAKRAEVFALDTEVGSEILSARLNAAGRLTVTTRAQSYKGVVTVYDANFQPQVSFRLSSRFVMDGLLSDDGKTVTILTTGQENGVFDCALAFYQTEGEAPFATLSLGSNMVLDLRRQGDKLWVVGENGLTVVGPEGTILSQYDYDSRYLKGFSLDGDGFATLLLGKYRTGSGTTLVSVDENGEELAAREWTDQVLDLTAAGRYTAVLTAGGLTIYTKDLEVYAALDNTGGARSVVLRSDGTAFLAGSETARLFIPE